ncbi:hypothetical protein [Prochlorococcus marinus]|uniref:hypothetical protein n=1 Tax=Prochlorococcus marinus TaxID=1219 RepID=UPI0007B34D10|nr:hypothetical protein [Prochlorococcus marinus]KZR78105.1 hypothetical protein PMIT1320_00187 [Prochlorococcus marinus str. MIT 1320]
MGYWKKLGRLIKPEDYNYDWIVTHAMDPTVLHLRDSIYRVYYCGRNNSNQSLIGYSDFDISNPTDVIFTSENEVLGLGDLGCFDDNGVTASCIVNLGKTQYLYYIGWKPRSTTRFGLMTGLAISHDNGTTFTRYSKAPILSLTDREPYSILTAPYVLKISDDTWYMWYVSCEGWIHPDLPTYNIKFATSLDGLTWKQDGTICLDFQENEIALARPCVLFEDDLFKMWISYKTETQSYRIGYAESTDGLRWERKDHLTGIDISIEDNSWDSEMIEYPCVFKHEDTKYMIYNGNGYGTNGAGIAIFVE